MSLAVGQAQKMSSQGKPGAWGFRILPGISVGLSAQSVGTGLECGTKWICLELGYIGAELVLWSEEKASVHFPILSLSTGYFSPGCTA